MKAEMMVNLLNLAMLVCAAIGSLVFGILSAYAILRAGFALMRPQRAVPIKASTPEPAGTL
jgi:hypothetical protein